MPPSTGGSGSVARQAIEPSALDEQRGRFVRIDPEVEGRGLLGDPAMALRADPAMSAVAATLISAVGPI